MEVPATTFIDDGGLVWVELGPEWSGFTEALNDGVSALSPRGQDPTLSTFWIDYALAQIKRPSGSRITIGNSTRLERTPAGVRAVSEYQLFDDEEMTLDAFEQILEAWRAEVLRRQESGSAARPAQGQYQRNPPP